MDPRWRAIREDGTDLPGEEHPAMVALRTGKSVMNFLMGVHAPGRQLPTWISVSAIPEVDPKSGKALSVFTSFEDITNRIEAQLAITGSEAKYRQLFQQLSVGFALHEIICDASGQPCDYRFLEVNEAFERLTGLSAERILGQRVREVLPELELYWIDRYGRVAMSGAPDQFELPSRDIGRSFDVRAFSPKPGQFAVLFQESLIQKNAAAESEGSR